MFRRAAEPYQAIMIVVLGLATFSIVLFGVTSLICGTVVSFAEFAGQDILCKFPHLENMFTRDEEEFDTFSVSEVSAEFYPDKSKLTITFEVKNNLAGVKPGAGLCSVDLRCFVDDKVLEPYTGMAYRSAYAGTYRVNITPTIKNTSDPIFYGDPKKVELRIEAIPNKCLYEDSNMDNNYLVKDAIENGECGDYGCLFDPLNYAIVFKGISGSQVSFEVKAINNTNYPKPVISIYGGTSRGLEKMLENGAVIEYAPNDCVENVCTKSKSLNIGDSSQRTCSLRASVGQNSHELNLTDNSILVFEDTTQGLQDELITLGSDDFSHTLIDNSVYFFQAFKAESDLEIRDITFFLSSGSDGEVEYEVYELDPNSQDKTPEKISWGRGSIKKGINMYTFEIKDKREDSDTYDSYPIVRGGHWVFIGIKPSISVYLLRSPLLDSEELTYEGYVRSGDLQADFSDNAGLKLTTDERYYLYLVFPGEKADMKMFLDVPYSVAFLKELDINVSTVDDSNYELGLEIGGIDEGPIAISSKGGNKLLEFTLPQSIDVAGNVEIRVYDIPIGEVAIPVSEQLADIVEGVGRSLSSIEQLSPNATVVLQHYPPLPCYRFDINFGTHSDIFSSIDYDDIIRSVENGAEATLYTSDECSDCQNAVVIDNSFSPSEDSNWIDANDDYLLTNIYTQLFKYNYNGGGGCLYLNYEDNVAKYTEKGNECVSNKAKILLAALIWATGKVR